MPSYWNIDVIRIPEYHYLALQKIWRKLSSERSMSQQGKRRYRWMNLLCLFDFKNDFTISVLVFQLKRWLMPDVSRFYFRTSYISLRYYFLFIYFCYNNPITLCHYVKGIRLSRAILPLARLISVGFPQTIRWLHYIFDQVPEKFDEKYRPTRYSNTSIWTPRPIILARRKTRSDSRGFTHIYDDCGANINFSANINGWLVDRSVERLDENHMASTFHFSGGSERTHMHSFACGVLAAKEDARLTLSILNFLPDSGTIPLPCREKKLLFPITRRFLTLPTRIEFTRECVKIKGNLTLADFMSRKNRAAMIMNWRKRIGYAVVLNYHFPWETGTLEFSAV